MSIGRLEGPWIVLDISILDGVYLCISIYTVSIEVEFLVLLCR
jgi:hypothetical protein